MASLSKALAPLIETGGFSCLVSMGSSSTFGKPCLLP